MTTRNERLQSGLHELRTSSPDIIGAAIVSIDGFIMTSVLPGDAEEEVIAAMSAALLGVGERISTELLKATMQQIFVKAPTGYVVMTAAGEEAVLVTLVNAKAKLGLVFLDTRRAANTVAQVI